MTSNPQELIGRTIGAYTLERLIGQGGFAWVFASRRAPDGKQVAVKLLKPRYGGDPQFEGRFRNESQVASEMSHPNIVHILEVGRADGFTFFSMDLYPESLASRLQRDAQLPEDELLAIAADIARGLSYAHETGIVHRDIKVDNVLLTEDARAVISDFGIARAASSYSTATGLDMTIGTPQYISPEQAQGRELDGRSDIYSLGVTLYRAAIGEAPFQSRDWFELARMHVEDRPPPPRKRRPELSERFERVILKCLAKHPDDRYASAAALLEEIEVLRDRNRSTESFGLAPQMTGEAPTTRSSRGRPGWLLAIVAVLVVIAVAVLVVILGE